jgi:ketosteroid isomerase-like protein
MSQENVERIRSSHDEVFNRSRRGLEDLQELASESFHPDVEWHDQRELPGATVHHGIERVVRHLAAAQETPEYGSTELLEILDAGRYVVAVYRFRARGRSSGVRVERDAAWVYGFRGPKVESVRIFGTRRDALEAVGLSE